MQHGSVTDYDRISAVASGTTNLFTQVTCSIAQSLNDGQELGEDLCK
jgi:hypothetical protein